MRKQPIPVKDLSEEQAAAELANLAAEIAHHDELYYSENNPGISDSEYDALRLGGQTSGLVALSA
ncbi:MAG: hypothetical protein MUE79_01600, partial [Nitratireductor sp.]|nr:hypothetical protein [Nitratireductor sp.]